MGHPFAAVAFSALLWETWAVSRLPSMVATDSTSLLRCVLKSAKRHGVPQHDDHATDLHTIDHRSCEELTKVSDEQSGRNGRPKAISITFE